MGTQKSLAVLRCAAPGALACVAAPASGGESIIARTGDTAVPGYTYSLFKDAVLNDRGNVVFTADLRTPSGDQYGSAGIFFAGSSTAPAVIAMAGSSYPGGTAPFYEFREPETGQAHLPG